ncbi:homocysteine S-methyltransferase family protein [candidate division WOR-3 bacterium]|nr:homocysteine S-methyltransferase family protein [candidate division WOR-3 bacterium]
MAIHFDDFIKRNAVIFDGGMGTSLASVASERGIAKKDGEIYEMLNLNNPDMVTGIHEGFLEAGCDVIETNTFGGDFLTLDDEGAEDFCRRINAEGARIAKKAAKKHSKGKKKRYVSGSIGPGRRFPVLGQITFDELFKSFEMQIQGLAEGGVDMLQIETCQDPIQVKAALAAAAKVAEQRQVKIPVSVLITIGEKGRTVAGMSCKSFLGTFQSYDFLAAGLNCGFGPKQFDAPIGDFLKSSPFDFLYLPNAGMPRVVRNSITYDCGPEEFAETVVNQAKKHGFRMMGGCCGVSFEHIRQLVIRTESLTFCENKKIFVPSLASLYSSVSTDMFPKPLIISEKTNASGSREFKKAVVGGDIKKVLDLALAEQKNGVHCLDLSLAVTGRNESRDFAEIGKSMGKILEVPVCADTTDEKSVNEFLKAYPGKTLVNSVSLENMEKASGILKTVREFGAAVVCILADEKGYAIDLKQKIEIARKIFDFAVVEHGIKVQDIFFDPLTFSLASADCLTRKSAESAIKSLKLLKEMFPGTKSILGISNVSHGFDKNHRTALNSVYLYHALKAGLDAAIIDTTSVRPIHEIPEKARISAEELIFSGTKDPGDVLAEFLGERKNEKKHFTKATENDFESDEDKLTFHIIGGREEGLEDVLSHLLKKVGAEDILVNILLPAMKSVGDRFERGETHLPFVLCSSQTMHKALEKLRPHLKCAQNNGEKIKIILATVKGDIHDIGKNIVRVILENSGIEVVDIGVDKSAEEIAASVKGMKPDFVGLSGLLISSAQYMKKVIEELKNSSPGVAVICGGAALSESYVKEVKEAVQSEVFYARDAFAAMKIMEERRGRFEKS